MGDLPYREFYGGVGCKTVILYTSSLQSSACGLDPVAAVSICWVTSTYHFTGEHYDSHDYSCQPAASGFFCSRRPCMRHSWQAWLAAVTLGGCNRGVPTLPGRTASAGHAEESFRCFSGLQFEDHCYTHLGVRPTENSGTYF